MLRPASLQDAAQQGLLRQCVAIGEPVEELTAHLDMGRPAAMRLFESMVEMGIATRTDGRRREMSRLAAQVHHRVWWAVLEGSFVMTIERAEFFDNETVSFPVANRSPWWLTASGIIIAIGPERRRRDQSRRAPNLPQTAGVAPRSQ